MGAKKKAPPKKAAKEGDEDDLSVQNFYKTYKKKVVEYGLESGVSKIIREAYQRFEDEDEKIKKFHLWEELGWPGVKAITDSLLHVGYPHCQSIRLWKTYCEDEGVRAVCEFMEKSLTVMCLEFLDCKVTSLGCEFIGKMFAKPMSQVPPVQVLKLDHNAFGSEGIMALAEGLKSNELIKTLSLCYCDIDHRGGRPLFEILIFQKSKLEELILTGNALRNEGVKQVLNGVSIAKELKKIYLADNQFNEEEDMLAAIKSCMQKNKTLARYDFRNNDLNDDAVIFFTDMLGPDVEDENGVETGKISHVTEIEISERARGKKEVEPATYTETGAEEKPAVFATYIKLFKEQLALNKPKKGKKGKKGGKKGKKKK